ncbi:hypothetical protein FRC17_000399 [Serendipita sp. 399]|nr:hypothetical protein FRC17_000399 [Serendipita sp. 399]
MTLRSSKSPKDTFEPALALPPKNASTSALALPPKNTFEAVLPPPPKPLTPIRIVIPKPFIKRQESTPNLQPEAPVKLPWRYMWYDPAVDGCGSKSHPV